MTTPTAPRVVLDASAVFALLADAGPAGQWVEANVADAVLCAPELMPFEVCDMLRRHAVAGLLDETAAALAHADLTALAIDLYPYAALAPRVWQLRANLTAYDGAYVAVAELVGAALITLDRRVSRAPGPQCPVIAYSDDARATT